MNYVGRRRMLRGVTFTTLRAPQSLNSACVNRTVRLLGLQRKNLPGLDIVTDNRIQKIKFNRPEKKNAFNVEIYDGLASLLREAARDEGVAVTVLTGAGNVYSSGHEFGTPVPDDIETLMDNVMDSFQEFVAALIDYPKLVVAVVNGPAVGAAATTLALCDVVYASDTAWLRTPFTRLGLVPEGCSSYTLPHILGPLQAWLRTPFTRLGLVPEGCSSYTLPHILGPLQAGRLLYLCETLSAEEGQRRGLITQVFPRDQLDRETSSRITEYTNLPLQTLRTVKKLVRGWDRETLHRVNQEEVRVLKKMFRAEEFHSAMSTFSDNKRK